MTRLSYIRALIGTVVLTGVVLVGMGCNAQPAQWSNLGDPAQEEPVDSQGKRVDAKAAKGLHVVPRPGSFVTELRAGDVVKILKAVGCSNDQILAIGADLRDVLAQTGAAEIVIDRRAEATIQVADGKILISSISRGIWMYNLRKAQIEVPNVMPGQPAPSAQAGQKRTAKK